MSASDNEYRPLDDIEKARIDRLDVLGRNIYAVLMEVTEECVNDSERTQRCTADLEHWMARAEDTLREGIMFAKRAVARPKDF